jgi:phosphatidylethanolamine-binding protein (PEBP) family uncharacterized protein
MLKETGRDAEREVLEEGQICLVYRPKVRGRRRRGGRRRAARRRGELIGEVGYDGALKSVGKTVRYRFRLPAVDRELGLAPGEDKRGVRAALAGHVLGEAALTVVHERQP